MSGGQKEQSPILSWNVTGCGTPGFLDNFTAESAKQYSLLVCDPVSIVHLFEKQSVYKSAVELTSSRTSRTLIVDDQVTLNNLSGVINLKTIEIVRYLVEGGRLVVFLRQPFSVVDTEGTVSFDNYDWLDTLRPCQKGKQILSVMAGDVSGCWSEDDEATGLLKDYLDTFSESQVQAISATELTPGYVPISVSSGSLVFAASLEIGACGGRIMYLPAPANENQFALCRRFILALAESARAGNSDAMEPGLSAGVPSESPALSLRRLKESIQAQRLESRVPGSGAQSPSSRAANEYKDLLYLLIYQDPSQIAARLKSMFVEAGWAVLDSGSGNEILVWNPDLESVIIRISSDDPDSILKDLSHLARAIIAAWADRETEPTGLLIGTARDIFKTHHRLRGLNFDPYEFGKRNNIKLLTTIDLVKVLEKMHVGSLTAEEACSQLIAGHVIEDEVVKNEMA